MDDREKRADEASASTPETGREARRPLRIAFGADHGGVKQKDMLRALLDSEAYVVRDYGTQTEAAVDYPDFALPVARAVASGQADFGVLVCGTGLGMAIAANKVPGVRAVPVREVAAARLAREHNDAQVLCLSGRFVTPEENAAIMRVFFETAFAKGRHQRRLDKIAESEHDKR
jgi:ribose 5-phosphate isomerase B